ncbi:uncharacterized protein TNCV_4386141 [Trichonephila clavipes]|nr:uncharacterized protein TNCV_4386141 [Trichonephila clavipes]
MRNRVSRDPVERRKGWSQANLWPTRFDPPTAHDIPTASPASLKTSRAHRSAHDVENWKHLKWTKAEATRGLLAMDLVILNHGQVTWVTPELAPPILTSTPHQREDVSALDRFNVHRCPTQRVFSGSGLELVTKQATI